MQNVVRSLGGSARIVFFRRFFRPGFFVACLFHLSYLFLSTVCRESTDSFVDSNDSFFFHFLFFSCFFPSKVKLFTWFSRFGGPFSRPSPVASFRAHRLTPMRNFDNPIGDHIIDGIAGLDGPGCSCLDINLLITFSLFFLPLQIYTCFSLPCLTTLLVFARLHINPLVPMHHTKAHITLKGRFHAGYLWRAAC